MCRILLADDDEEDQQILLDAMSKEAFAAVVHCEWNGQKAFDYLEHCEKDNLPDIILLDYKMPIMGASEFLEKTGEGSRYAQISKIVWSSSNNEEHQKSCIAMGAVNYFTKPSSYSGLIPLIRMMQEVCKNKITGHL